MKKEQKLKPEHDLWLPFEERKAERETETIVNNIPVAVNVHIKEN